MPQASPTGRHVSSKPNIQNTLGGSAEAKIVISAFTAAAANGRRIFCDDPIDVAWLRETHLAHVTDLTDFKSFELEGNEDAPTRVWVYSQRHPSVFDRALATFCQDALGVLN